MPEVVEQAASSSQGTRIRQNLGQDIKPFTAPESGEVKQQAASPPPLSIDHVKRNGSSGGSSGSASSNNSGSPTVQQTSVRPKSKKAQSLIRTSQIKSKSPRASKQKKVNLRVHGDLDQMAANW